MKFWLFLVPALSLTAGIQLETAMPVLDRSGTSGQGGAVTFVVNGDEFADATPTDPVFIKVSLPEGAVLCTTLVDASRVDNAGLPIFLALQYGGSEARTSVVAPGDTASIVRQVEGERALWLRIQRPGSEWLQRDGIPLAPDPSNPVRWTIGVSARDSVVADSVPSNLAFNSRLDDVLPGAHPRDAVSTLLCLDLSRTDYAEAGDANLDLTLETFDARAEIAPGVFAAGAAGMPSFADNLTIGLARENTCTATPVGAGPADSLTLDVSCPDNGASPLSQLHAGSYVRLSTEGRGGYGFASEQDLNWRGASSMVELKEPFQLEGRTLYRTADIVFTDASLSLDAVQRITLDAVVTNPDNLADVMLNWSMVLVTNAGEPDAAPYGGSEQKPHCIPGEAEIGRGRKTVAGADDAVFIIGQPAAFTRAVPGDNVVLRVVVDCSEPFTYQWFREGSPLSGENGPELTLLSVERSDSSMYKCRVTRGNQEVFSNRSNLLVSDVTPIVVSR